MSQNISYQCSIEYSIGPGSAIENGNRIFFRIANPIEYSIGCTIFYSIFYRIL